MHVDTVRRRLIESTLHDLIAQAEAQQIFSREVIVQGLVLCGGSVEQFNTHYNSWRKVMALGAMRWPSNSEKQFLHYVRERSAPVPVLDVQASDAELMERGIEVQVVLSKFPWHMFDAATAAQCLCACDGHLRDCCEILRRLHGTLDGGGAPPSRRWLVWNVSRLYRDRWASLREDWRYRRELQDAALSDA